MDRLDLEVILSDFLGDNEDISGFNFSPGNFIRAELYGRLTSPPALEDMGILQDDDTEIIAEILLEGKEEMRQQLDTQGACDFSFIIGGTNRFRVNIFRQSGKFSVVLRRLSSQILSLDDLDSPPVFKRVAFEHQGLVIVAGATNQGKSTTIAAIIHEINRNLPHHIVTLEDPIEFVHKPVSCVVNQREKGTDFSSYRDGLRAALRQSPHVILIGEVRDADEMEVVLSAAETGHLVITTLHATSVRGTIQRIAGMYSGAQEIEIRNRLASCLKWVIGQRLVPKVGGGRTAIHEILGNNYRMQELIRKGEGPSRTYEQVMEQNSHDGWQTYDQACLEAFKKHLISKETAIQHATTPGHVGRSINHLQNSLNDYFSAPSGLRLME